MKKAEDITKIIEDIATRTGTDFKTVLQCAVDMGIFTVKD